MIFLTHRLGTKIEIAFQPFGNQHQYAEHASLKT